MTDKKSGRVISEEDYDILTEYFAKIEGVALKYMPKVESNCLIIDMMNIFRKTVIESRKRNGEND